jgi:RNA polymerase-binding protein DksA
MAAKKPSAIQAVKEAVTRATGRGGPTIPASPSSKKTSAARVKPKQPPAAQASASVSPAKDAPTKASTSVTNPAKKAAKKATKKTTKRASRAAAASGPAPPASGKGSAKAAGKAAQRAPKNRQRTTPTKTARKVAVTTTQKVTEKTAGRSAKASAKLAVRDGERPWTAGEVAEVREALRADEARLRAEIAAAEEEIGHLLREGGEGAGNDQADVGSNTFERDHEMSMAKNARDNLLLVQSALQRIDDGTYGVCESCGQPIGKMRLQAFPRATLCMECKQRQERR